MKFICDRKEITDGLLFAGFVASQRTIKPILQDIKIHAFDDFIELSATDLEVSIRYRIEPVSMEETGVALVPASKINRIFKEESDKTVSFCANEGICTISFLNSQYRLSGEDPDQFPNIPAFSERDAFSLETKVLKELIRKTIFAVSRDDTQHAMNGVLFECEEGNLTMVSTDGRRMAICTFKADLPEKQRFSVIVPKKGLEQIERAIECEEEKVYLNIDVNQILVKTSKTEICSRLIEGNFPDYKNIVPKEWTRSLQLDVVDFMTSIKQGSVVTDTNSRIIKLIFKENQLVVVARPPDGDEATVKRKISYNQEEFLMSFNPDFLLEGIKAIESEEKIEFKMKEKLKPGIITNNKDYKYLIMPLNIEEREEDYFESGKE